MDWMAKTILDSVPSIRYKIYLTHNWKFYKSINKNTDVKIRVYKCSSCDAFIGFLEPNFKASFYSKQTRFSSEKCDKIMMQKAMR